MKVWNPASGFPAAYLTKGLGIPRESDLSPAGFDHKTYTGMGETGTWRAQTKPCMHQDSEERSNDYTGN